MGLRHLRCCCKSDGLVLVKENEYISRWCRYVAGASTAAGWEIESSWVDPADDGAEWVAIHPDPYNRVFVLKNHTPSSVAYAVIECWDFKTQELLWDFETTAGTGATDPGLHVDSFRYQTSNPGGRWRSIDRVYTSQSSGVLFRPAFTSNHQVLVEPDGTRTEYPSPASSADGYTSQVTERWLQGIASYDWQDACGLEKEYIDGGTAIETGDTTNTTYIPGGGFGGTWSYSRTKTWKYDLSFDYRYYTNGATDLSDYTCSGGTLIRTETYDPNETTSTNTNGSGYPNEAAALAAAAADPPPNPGAHPAPESVSSPNRGFIMHDVYNSTTFDVIEDENYNIYFYLDGTLVDSFAGGLFDRCDFAAAVDGGGVYERDGELYGVGAASAINDINGTSGISKIIGVSDDFVLVFGLRDFATFSEGRYAGVTLKRSGVTVTNWQIWAYRLSDEKWYPMRTQSADDSEFTEILYGADVTTEDYAIDTVKQQGGQVYPQWTSNQPAY